MGKYQKLGKNVALLTVGNFASKLLSFLLVPFYTAILSTEEYGTADVITTSVNLIMPIFTLVIYEAVLRFALDKTGDKKQVFSVGLYISLVGCAVVVAGAQFLRFFDTVKLYVWQFVLYYISLIVYNLVLQFVKGIEKVTVYSIAGVVNTFIYIGCNILFLLVFNWGVKGYLSAFIVGHAVAALYAFLAAKVYKYIISFSKIKLSLVKQMVKYAAPMIPNTVSWWVSNSSDKYILIYFWGVAVNGIYSVAYKIPSILTIVITIFISAWQISAVENFGSEESKKFYANIYDKYESLLYIGAAILIGAVQILAKFLFSNDFYLAWKYTPVLICASMFNSLAAFYGSVYTSSKKTKMLFYSTLIGAIANIGLNFALIPSFGAMGAAIATMVSYMIIWVVRAIHSRRLFQFNIRIKRDILVYFILGAETVLISMDKNPYYIVSVVSVLAICLICRDIFADVLKLVVKKLKKS
ncbi:MAG: polysaccharide biosynthesis C-terminal domain-containing protein [Acutalibacteraceae bacterium]